MESVIGNYSQSSDCFCNLKRNLHPSCRAVGLNTGHNACVLDAISWPSHGQDVIINYIFGLLQQSALDITLNPVYLTAIEMIDDENFIGADGRHIFVCQKNRLGRVWQTNAVTLAEGLVCVAYIVLHSPSLNFLFYLLLLSSPSPHPQWGSSGGRPCLHGSTISSLHCRQYQRVWKRYLSNLQWLLWLLFLLKLQLLLFWSLPIRVSGNGAPRFLPFPNTRETSALWHSAWSHWYVIAPAIVLCSELLTSILLLLLYIYHPLTSLRPGWSADSWNLHLAHETTKQDGKHCQECGKHWTWSVS